MPRDDTFAEKTALPGVPVYAPRALASGVKTAPLYGVPSAPTTVNVTADVALQWPGDGVGDGVAAGDGVACTATRTRATTAARKAARVGDAILQVCGLARERHSRWVARCRAALARAPMSKGRQAVGVA